MRLSCVPALLLLVAFAGCGDDDLTDPADDRFVVQGEAVTFAEPAGSSPATLPIASVVDPSSFEMEFYRIYLATNEDCSSPILVADNGATPVAYDLLSDPTIFDASGTPGTYDCLILRISDVLTFVPATSEGPCVAGTTYQTDVYRDGETDWRDADGNPIVGTGEDATPSDDSPDVLFSTNPSAVIARGYSPNQVQLLRNSAVVPGTSTFAYDLTGSVGDEGGTCRGLPGVYEFR